MSGRDLGRPVDPEEREQVRVTDRRRVDPVTGAVREQASPAHAPAGAGDGSAAGAGASTGSGDASGSGSDDVVVEAEIVDEDEPK